MVVQLVLLLRVLFSPRLRVEIFKLRRTQFFEGCHEAPDLVEQ